MKFNRREFLGLSSALAANSILANNKVITKSPQRVMFICSSLGFLPESYFPKDVGIIKSSSYLKNMRSLNKMTVFENFYHPGMKISNHDSEKSLLTGASNPESPSFKNTISIDQKLVEALGTETRFPSLTLAVSDRGWGQSWSETGSAIPPIYDANRLYNMLFGKEDRKKVAAQLENDQEIIKCLQAEALTNAYDKITQDRYIRNLNKLRLEFDRQEYWLNKAKPIVPNNLSSDKKYPFSTLVKNLLDLSRDAFITDSTRIITLSLEFIEGAIKVPGTEGSWHTFSHHNSNPKLVQSLQSVETNILKNVDQFIYDLDQIPEGTGTVLDNTTVILCSNMGNAHTHSNFRLPIMVAGGGYKHRGHVKFNKDTPLCNLYLEMLNNAGIECEKFSSSEKNMGLLI